jgi:hypothetical protein
MKSSEQTVLLPQANGQGLWRGRGSEPLQPLDSDRRSGVEWVGLPTRTVVSLPMRLDHLEPARRQGAATLELEAVGFADQVAAAGQRDSTAVAVADSAEAVVCNWVQVPGGEAAVQAPLDAKFAPASWFRVLEPGVAQLWREGGCWVLGLPNERGQLLHAQAMSGRLLDADFATQLRCVMASLEVLGVSANWKSLCVFDHEGSLNPEFVQGLDLPVEVGQLAHLRCPVQSPHLVPPPVAEARAQRHQRRVNGMAFAAVVLVLACALGAFALRVWMRERDVAGQRRQLDLQAPEIEAIRKARSAWDDLAAALRPDDYPVEAIYQMVGLMPSEGIRVTRFELNSDRFAIDGEATSLGHGVEFRDKLTSAPAFKKWTWNFPQPQVSNDGRAQFSAMGVLADAQSNDPSNGGEVAP